MKTKQSMTINGVYLEDVISEYTTVGVTGRESIDIEVNTEDVGVRSGSIYKNKRYGTRTLTVSFVIKGEDSTDLLSKLNELNYYLNVEEAQFVFDDENDKYYVGTPNEKPDVSISTPGGSDFGVAVGSFDILCSDPFKYSVDEYYEPFEMDGDKCVANVVYNGTGVAYPNFEAFMYSKNRILNMYNPNGETNILEYDPSYGDAYASDMDGNDAAAESKFVAFVDNNDHVLQFGDPDASDNDIYVACDKTEDYRPRSGTETYYYIFSPQTNQFIAYYPTREQYESDPSTYYRIADQNTVLINNLFNKRSDYSDRVQRLWTDTLPVGFSLPAGYHNNSQSPLAMDYDFYKVDQTPVKDEVIFTKFSDDSTTSPNIQYALKYSVVERTASSVKLKFAVNWYKSNTKGIPTKAKVVASIFMKDSTQALGSVVLHKTNAKTGMAAKKTKSGSGTINITLNDIGYDKYEPELQFQVDVSGGSGNAGKVKKKNFKMQIHPYAVPDNSSYFLGARPTQSSIYKNDWNGPVFTRMIPTTTGVSDYELTFDLYYGCGDFIEAKLQQGTAMCLVIGGDGLSGLNIINPQIIAGMVFQDNSGSAKSGTLQVLNSNGIVSDKTINSIDYSYETRNRTCSIIKDSNGLQFKYTDGTNERVITDYSDTAKNSKKAYAVLFGFFSYQAIARFDWMGLKSVKFTSIDRSAKQKYTTPFKMGDILSANTRTGKVYLNNLDRTGLGALGNDWDNMVLLPGNNMFVASCSQLMVDNPATVLRRCRGYAYYQCGTEDYISGSTYWRLNDETKVFTAVIPTESEFNETPTSFFTKDLIDPYDPDQTYYDSDGDIFFEVTQEDYEAHTNWYFVKEPAIPQFRVRYREVFI